MSKQKTLQRISIVFEETGEVGKDSRGNPGTRFNVYLEGQTRKLDQVNSNDLSPTEFWASRCFNIVAEVMKNAGAVKHVRTRKDDGVKQ